MIGFIKAEAGAVGGLGVATQARVCAIRVHPNRIISHRNRRARGHQVAAGDREIACGVFGQDVIGLYRRARCAVRGEGTDRGSTAALVETLKLLMLIMRFSKIG
jgi:hypothetical protein